MKLFPTLALMLSLAGSAPAADKPRLLVLTDISPDKVEPDDMESIIRLFVHADLFEIEGLVHSTGWSASTAREDYYQLIHEAIDLYEKDLPNLRKRSDQTDHLHDSGTQQIGYWPSPDYLRKRSMIGSKHRGQKFIGEKNNSPGSDFIIKLADENDDRPLWISVWGGGNTLAQAIWQVKETRSKEELKNSSKNSASTPSPIKTANSFPETSSNGRKALISGCGKSSRKTSSSSGTKAPGNTKTEPVEKTGPSMPSTSRDMETSANVTQNTNTESKVTRPLFSTSSPTD